MKVTLARLAVGFVLCGAAVRFVPTPVSLPGRAQAQEPKQDNPFGTGRPDAKPADPFGTGRRDSKSDDPFGTGRPDAKPAAPAPSPEKPVAVPGLANLPADDHSTAIQRKLAGRQPAKYEDVPLQDVLRDIAQRYGIDFFVRRDALEDSGVSLDRPVTVQLASVTGRVLLDLLLADQDLVHTIHDGFVVVTTEEDLESYFVDTRVYDCTSLLATARSMAGASAGAAQMGMMSGMAGMGGMPGMGMGDMMGMGGGMAVGMGPGEKSESPASRLIDLIQTTISPHTWQSVGGPSSMELWDDRLLVVRTTPLVHRELSQLLGELQAMRPMAAR